MLLLMADITPEESASRHMGQREWFLLVTTLSPSPMPHISLPRGATFSIGPTSRPTPRLMTRLRETTLLDIRKTLNGVCFIVVYFEDCIQFRDLQ
jgi:hypothetical protein